MSKQDRSPDDYSRLADEELLETYERTSGTPGDAHVDALLAEIQRRGLDV